MRSCDDGQTWSVMWEHDSSADCFHDPDSLYPRPVYGNGRWVVPSGWGDPGAVYVSEDGADWTRHDPVVIDGEDGSVDGAGVFFDGAEFRIFRDLQSADGISWTRGEDIRPPGVGAIRRVAHSLEDGLLVILGNEGEVFVSTDDGVRWSDPTLAAAVCQSSQHRGDIAIGNGRIVVAGPRICTSSDAGASWTGMVPHSDVRDIIATADGFVAVHRDGTVSRSDDALAWEVIGEIGFDFDAAALAPGGDEETLVVYAAVDGQDAQLFRSTDGGETWGNVASAPGTDCPRINLETFVVPAEVCS